MKAESGMSIDQLPMFDLPSLWINWRHYSFQYHSSKTFPRKRYAKNVHIKSIWIESWKRYTCCLIANVWSIASLWINYTFQTLYAKMIWNKYTSIKSSFYIFDALIYIAFFISHAFWNSIQQFFINHKYICLICFPQLQCFHIVMLL